MDELETILENHFREEVSVQKNSLNKFAKRGLDIAVSSVSLLLSVPIIIAASAITVYDSGLPIFFKQERFGYRGEKFVVRKIRTMFIGSEEKIVNHKVFTDTKYWFVPYDSEVYTKLGRYLDCTHINELPQLWDVLKGKMSLVGNRPQAAYVVKELINSPGYIGRFDSKPGLFGPVQLLNRHHHPEEVIINLERKYSEIYNKGNVFFEDIKILLNSARMYFKEILTKKYYKNLTSPLD